MKNFKQFVEGYKGDKKEKSLYARYKKINDPQRPPDPLKPKTLGESVNISGDFNGNLYINSQPEQQVEESYVADILWEGNLYRLELKGRMPSKDELAENLQTSYPGALVQQIYPIVESELNIKSAKRYHPAKLDWV